MFGVGFLPYPSVFDKTFSTQFLNGGKQEKMKKRLLSMLMAVLMIASLVPATAMAAGNHANCDVLSVNIAVDAAKKQPGIEFAYCNTDNEVVKELKVTPFADKADVNKCAALGHNWKTVELQAAACEKKGISLTYCADCGTYKTGSLDITKAAGHTYVDFTAFVKPTCKNDGWGYAVCKDCKNPVFIANSVVAESIFKSSNEKYTNAQVKAVVDKFVKTGHVDTDKLVTVDKDVYNADGSIKYHAAVKPTHVAMVNGEELKVWKAVITGDEVTFTQVLADKTRGNGQGHTGDAYCPDCGDVIVKDKPVLTGNVACLNDAHATALTVKTGDEGYYPYIDAAGKHDGKTDRVYCSICKEYFGGDKLAFDQYYNPYNTNDLTVGQTFEIPAVAATCTKDGNTAKTLTWTKKGWAVTDKGEVIPATGHHWAKLADVPATCDKPGYTYDNVYACDNTFVGDDGKTYVCGTYTANGYTPTYMPGTNTNKQITEIPADHSYATKVIVEPTCSSNGLSVKYCTACGVYDTFYGTPTVYVVPAVTHVAAADLVNVKAATCTEDGYTGDSVCKWCGKVLKAGEVVKAAGHTPEEVAAVAATCTETGLTAGSKCSVCGEVLTAQEVVPALGHKFENGVCTVCGEKDPNYVPPVVNPFKDVEKSSPYYDAIIWAADKGVTTGKTADTFGINDGCTRAQIVTFLYRAAGSPAVKADTVNPFTDVSKDSVYYNAILWAVENGITKGTTETTFDPNAVCTRGQIVTFLFRASGDEKVATGTDFADVASGSYCADAVAWAVANKVANGFADGTFRPEATCTRGQAVTFIFRALAK